MADYCSYMYNCSFECSGNTMCPWDKEKVLKKDVASSREQHHNRKNAKKKSETIKNYAISTYAVKRRKRRRLNRKKSRLKARKLAKS